MSGKPKPQRLCLGFGPYESKCPNPTGPRSPYWCDRCEDLRREHITKQLEAIRDDFERRATEGRLV